MEPLQMMAAQPCSYRTAMSRLADTSQRISATGPMSWVAAATVYPDSSVGSLGRSRLRPQSSCQREQG